METQVKDIVIPYIKSNTDELKYCLRSLKNITHGNVFICGDRPDFISDKVIYIPRVLKGNRPQYDSELNIRLALLDNRLSDDFILFNDDFYILKQCNELLNYHAGEIKDIIKQRNNRIFAVHNKYLSDTKSYLNDDSALSYELHIPMIFNKNKRLQVSNEIMPLLSKGRTVLPRSIYGNRFCDISIIKQDVKIYDENDKIADDTFLSTYESTFTGSAGDIIRSNFSNKCKYEV